MARRVVRPVEWRLLAARVEGGLGAQRLEGEAHVRPALHGARREQAAAEPLGQVAPGAQRAVHQRRAGPGALSRVEAAPQVRVGHLQVHLRRPLRERRLQVAHDEDQGLGVKAHAPASYSFPPGGRQRR